MNNSYGQHILVNLLINCQLVEMAQLTFGSRFGSLSCYGEFEDEEPGRTEECCSC